MRAAGIRKPILLMSETSEEEAVELVHRDVTLSCWLDDAGERLERVSRKARRPVGVHLYIDAGMGREGMLYQRALPWIEDLARRPSILIHGTYQMFVHEVEFDRVQLQRFQNVAQEAARKRIKLGRLHAAPTFELFHLPESHLDMVRVGQAIFGHYPPGDVQDRALLKPVFRLRARVVRAERFEPGFAPWFMWDQPRWLGLLPVGHTDGYPSSAAGTCQVLINSTLYPVVAIFSAHTILDLGPEKVVNVGEMATLVGPDNPAIDPVVVGQNVKLGFYEMITKFSALLPRRMV